MNSKLRWAIAIFGWIILLLVYGIWRDIEKHTGGNLITAGIRGAIVFGGIYFLYMWAKAKTPTIKQIHEQPLDQESKNKHFYAKVAEEIQNKEIDPGLLAQAMAEANGEKEKARSIYIKLRVNELIFQSSTEKQKSQEKNKTKNRETFNSSLNNIGKYIYGSIFLFLLLSIFGMLTASLNSPISENTFFGLIPLVITIPLAIFAYRKYIENAASTRKPNPKTHIRCPDCKSLIEKESRICKHCGCKLIPQ